MGNSLCWNKRFPYSGPADSCEFYEWNILRDYFLHDPIYISLMLSFSLSLILFLWMADRIISKLKNFTRPFVCSNLAVLTILTVLSFLKHISDHYLSIGATVNAVSAVIDVVQDTFFACFPLSSSFFLLQSLYVFVKGKEVKGGCLFYLFLPILLALIEVTLNAIFPAGNFENTLINGSFIILPIVGVLVLCSLICCSPDSSKVHTVPRAKSRLGWSFLFILVAIFPQLAARLWFFYLYHFFGYPSVVNTHIFVLCTHLFPIFFVISTVVFLPDYRSALCCSDGAPISSTPKVPPPEKTTKMTGKEMARITEQNINTGGGIEIFDIEPKEEKKEPILPAAPPQITEPTAPLMIPAPPTQPQPCTCVHGNLLSPHQQPIFFATTYRMPAQTVQYYRPIQYNTSSPSLLTHQQFVSNPTSHGNLVRYSSHPMLTTIQMDPGRTDQVTVPQSPFFIPS